MRCVSVVDCLDGGPWVVYGRRSADSYFFFWFIRRERSLYLGNGVGNNHELVYGRWLEAAERYRYGRGALARAAKGLV